jgi:error-prone DNA polymerase
MVGWLITEKSAQTKHGDHMEFATFEDLTWLYDATFFPEPYRRFGHLPSGEQPYMLEGFVEEFDTFTLLVSKMEVLSLLSIGTSISACTNSPHLRPSSYAAPPKTRFF